MKQIVCALLMIISFQSHSQADTMIAYYESGQIRAISPRLDGKAHGKPKTWFESGQLSSKGLWKKGKQIRTTNYHENGNKSFFVRYKKWKMKSKLWHPNGQIWSKGKSQYDKSIDLEFDSAGVILHKIIERNGSSVSCSTPVDSNPSDSSIYKDGSCVCSWGKGFWRNGVWIDEKGRDMNADYS